MPIIETFDEFEATAQSSLQEQGEPFALREDTSEKGTLEWLNNFFDASLQVAQSRLEIYRRYINYYKNIQWRSSAPRDYNRDSADIGRRNPRMSLNYFYECVESKVSQRAKNRISVAVIPNNDEQSDINNAKLFKMLLDYRAKELDVDHKNQKADRILFLMGHVFFYMYWDKNLGQEHPAYKMAMTSKDPAVLAQAKALAAAQGTTSIKVGDVNMKVLGPDRVFPELGKKSLEEMNYIDIVEWRHKKELQAEYPDKEKELDEGSTSRSMYHYEIEDQKQLDQYVLVHEFYHKPTRFLEKGVYIKFARGAILEMTDYPFEHGMLPVVDDRDIEIYNDFWGRPFVGNIEQLQRMNNNIFSAIARNEVITSAPKWMVPKGTVKFSSLNNEITIVEYSGPVAPQLVTNNGTSPRSIEILKLVESKLYGISGIYDISRGQVPAGVTANSALRFLDEQESQRDNTGIQKRRTRIVQQFEHIKALMCQFYRGDDKRIVKIIGPENDYMVETMTDIDAAKEFDVKLLNQNALSDTKAGKIADILDLNAASPQDPPFKKEEIYQMLDLGMNDAFKSEATIAVTAAKTIIDAIYQGKGIPEPSVTDNLLVHYGIFYRELQSFHYRTKVPPQTQTDMQKYVTTLEYLMFVRASKNITFLNKLMALDMYPMFYTLPMSLMQIMAQSQAPMAPPPSSNAPVNSGAMKNTQDQITKEMNNE